MRSSAVFAGDDRGSVLPLVALSLTALIGVGGLAFDYARLTALDTELQQASDQAALAAATQLDGQSGACARAAAAAQNLLVNQARFANDGGGVNVTLPAEPDCDGTGQIKFYQSWDTSSDSPGTAATADANAKFVSVQINTRTANYAFTPIVAAFSSTVAARAVATLGAGAICKVPPLMICNPAEGATDPSFPKSSDVGRGLKLEAGGGTTWAPGNYGYLNFPGGSSLEEAMGKNSQTEPCTDASSVSTKPGNTASAPAGINTRFDIYQNGLVNVCDRATGNCSPALNVTKDVVHPQFTLTSAGVADNASNCGYQTGSDPWDQPSAGKRYVPGKLASAIAAMGAPRDICHAANAAGSCTSGRFGDGNWDRALYFAKNHARNDNGATAWAEAVTWAGKVKTATTGPTALSRYDVYKWELQYWAKTPLAPRSQLAEQRQKLNPQGKPTGQSTNYYSYSKAQCAIPQGATSTIKDRRVLTAAVVNCTAGSVKGSTNIKPAGWIDLFLVEPSLDRRDDGNNVLTSKDQIYVEIIGKATKPNGDANTFQYFLRQRPRLVR